RVTAPFTASANPDDQGIHTCSTSAQSSVRSTSRRATSPTSVRTSATAVPTWPAPSTKCRTLDLHPAQVDHDPRMPAGERRAPDRSLAHHFPHLAPDLHTVRRLNIGAGRGVDSDADDHALPAKLGLLIGGAWRDAAAGDVQPGGVAPVPHLVAVPVGDQRSPDTGAGFTRGKPDGWRGSGFGELGAERRKNPVEGCCGYRAAGRLAGEHRQGRCQPAVVCGRAGDAAYGRGQDTRQCPGRRDPTVPG